MRKPTGPLHLSARIVADDADELAALVEIMEKENRMFLRELARLRAIELEAEIRLIWERDNPAILRGGVEEMIEASAKACEEALK